MPVQYAAEARKDLQSLDKAVATRIIKKITAYASTVNPLIHAKALSGNLKGLYRFRVGDYRIIFTISEDGTVSILTILTILTIAHRKDVYR